MLAPRMANQFVPKILAHMSDSTSKILVPTVGKEPCVKVQEGWSFLQSKPLIHLSAKEFTWRMQHGRKLMLKKGPQSAARINSWPSTPASFTQSPSEQFQQHTSVQVHHWGSQVSPTKQSKQSSSRALTSRSYQRSLPGTRWGLWGARCASAWHPCGPWRSARSGLLV